jgi:hypothetical protein
MVVQLKFPLLAGQSLYIQVSFGRIPETQSSHSDCKYHRGLEVLTFESFAARTTCPSLKHVMLGSTTAY